ncbi:unnamed protein product [Dracunculus medinensis]|uniref:Uncharacterized protein n=1 Tax=Dracunculus medinensis TaxID=318479 RepID=A0A3P7PAL1_DRAME|nr:unnamed protein product [Dracunculus medinensis]
MSVKNKWIIIFKILAFNVEVALVRDQIFRNSGTTRIARLQFWKDAIDSIYGDGIIPRQPVAAALNCFAKSANVNLLRLLITARQRTLGDRPFDSIEAVSKYGVYTYGSVIKLIMEILSDYLAGVNEIEAAAKAANSMGEAMAMINLLRTIAPLISRGIVLLPADLLKTYNLTAEQICFQQASALPSLAKDLCFSAETFIKKSRLCIKELTPALRLALMANGVTVDYVLRISQRCNYNIFDRRLQMSCSFLPWRLWWRRFSQIY